MIPGEVAKLTVNDVDWGRNIFIIRETKTGFPRFVPIPPNIKKLLKKYLASLETEYLFPSQKGGYYNGEEKVVNHVDWGYNFHVRIKRLGIKRKNLTPYSLRHSLITRLLEEDVNLFKVQKLVGHKQISTTANYTHLTIKDLQETIKKHPLVRRLTSPQVILKSLKNIIQSFQLEKDNRFAFKLSETENTLTLKIKIK